QGDVGGGTGTGMGMGRRNAWRVGGEGRGRLQTQLRRLSTGTSTDLHMPGLVTAMLAYAPADTDGFGRRLEALTAGRDRETAVAASHWLSNLRENEGDPAGAIEAAERALALARGADGPRSRAMAHATLARLTLQMGARAAAV